MGEEKTRSAERIDALRDGANAAAGFVRNLYFTFLLLGTYIAVIIGSTTDVQLLRIAPVTLPILGVELPIVAFYAVVPWLFLLFHFNLLLQLYLLSRRLHLLDSAIAGLGTSEQEEQQALLYPFVFSHMLIGRQYGWFTHWLFKLMVWITVILLPLVLLLWAEVRFLPYHDAGITAWARSAVLVDVVFLWVFWPMIVTPPGRRVRDWWGTVGAVALRAPAALWRRFRPASRNAARTGAPGTRYFLPMAATSAVVLILSHLTAVLPDSAIERRSARHLPDVLVHTESSGPHGPTFVLTHLLFDAPEAPLHRNLRLKGEVLTTNELTPRLADGLRSADEAVRADALAQVAGIALANRDLRFADLRNAIVPKADLRGANLDGADLRRADLHGADLRPFEIAHAGLCKAPHQELELRGESHREASGLTLEPNSETPVCRTSLRRGRLSESTLTASRLPFARLENADLQKAVLEGAHLQFAGMKHARLRAARLTDATLQEAELQYADLGEAILSGADLRLAALNEADLREADLSNANLAGDPSLLRGWAIDRADLTGATLPERAPLAGATLRSLRGVHLVEADLRRANLEGARLELANLTRARLTGATLKDAVLLGACLPAADLRGANVQNADLRGVFASGDLSGADLARAQLRGAHFHEVRVDLADLRRLGRIGLDEDRYAELAGVSDPASDACPGGRAADRLTRASRKQDDRLRMLVYAGQPALCSDRPDDPIKRVLEDKCIHEDDIDAYIGRLARFGCEDPDLAYGLARRAVIWGDYLWNALFYHRGADIGPMATGLAAALLHPDCAAGASFEDELAAELARLAGSPRAEGGSSASP